MFKRLKERVNSYIEQRVTEKLAMSALDVSIDIVTGNQVEGDYLEFGVYRGSSFIRAYRRFERNLTYYDNKKQIRYFAFDSFLGLPDSAKKYKPSQYKEGSYASTEELFLTNLKINGVDFSKVVVIKGWYHELNDDLKRVHGLRSACLVYLDCDLYESARDALDFVKDLLVDGSIIVIDDFFRHRCSADFGVRKAWEEFLQCNKNIQTTMVHCFQRVAFVVQLR